MKALKALAAKKTIFAFVLALTIFGAVYGFAATLNVGSDQLSAGNAVVGSCQPSGTPTGSTYAVAYDPAVPGYKVSSVTVTGIDASCAGKTVSVTLTGPASASLGQVTGTVLPGGGSLGMPVAAPISAAAVTGLSVAING